MIYRSQTFELDTERRELRQHGRPLAMPPKVFAVLVHLVQHNDRMVSKIELMDKFWPSNASEAALQTTISQLRKALGDTRQAQSVLRTHHGHGLRFVAPLTVVEDETEQPVKGDGAATVEPLRERRLAAVLYLRLCETGAGSVPADLRQDLRKEAHTAVQAIVESHDGQLLHLVIDGLSTVFGLAQSYEDSARRAVHCAAELAEAPVAGLLKTIGLTPAFSVDIGYLDMPGGTEHAHWAPPTSTERVATELALRAAPGDILLSDATLHHLGDEVETETVAGGHRLLAISHQRTGIPARERTRKSAFVGRSAELAFLSVGLDLLRDGNGQAVVLLGPPGIGKTRLVSEFLAGLDENAFRSLVVNCLPRLANTPMAPVREMCLSLFADPLSELTLDATETALLHELLEDAAPPNPSLAALSDHQRKEHRHALVDRLLQAASRDRPLVVVLEDVHWIDTSSRDLLDALAERIDQRRLMLVMTTRPTEQPLHSEALLQLSPLGRKDCVELLRSIPEFSEFDDSHVETLIQRAAGNPFFLEELALAAQSGADPTRELPGTVNAVISARIGGLGDRLRALLYVFAVVGPRAPVDLAIHLLGQPSDTLAADCRGLIRMGFLREDAGGFSFRHMLINDAAYAMLSLEDRKRLHLETALYLDARKDQDRVRPEVLAWHFQEAGETAKAISLWSTACRFALRRSAHQEAVAFARSGIALIGSDMKAAQSKELQLQLSLALGLTALRGFAAEEVGSTYLRARTLAKETGSAKARFQVSVGLWVHTWVLGQLSQSMGHAEDLLQAARTSNKPILKAQAHAAAGEVLVHQGDLAAGLGHLKTGLGFIESAPPDSIPAQNAVVACAAYASWATSLLGASDAALEFVTRSEEICQIFDNPFAEAIHCALCAGTNMFLGEAKACLGLAERAVEISREQDFPFWLGTGLVERGWALGRLGELASGVRIDRRRHQGVRSHRRRRAAGELVWPQGGNAAGRRSDARRTCRGKACACLRRADE
jgi:DNA-binding winged helix-turn-helix (wHTH) protein